jgi:hypothetical protein
METSGFSLRILYPDRRTEVHPRIRADFLTKLRSAKEGYPAARILNFDGTSRQCHLGPRKVVTEKGTDTVKLNAPRGAKQCDTGYGCISTAREKLPFWVLTQGKTNRSHAKFGAALDVIIEHTPNGWTPNDLMVKYIEWLSRHCWSELLMLVLDVSKAHRPPKLRHRAQELGIELLFARAGGTSLYQPLD